MLKGPIIYCKITVVLNLRFFANPTFLNVMS